MKKGWIIIICISVILTVCFYLLQFNKGISDNASDWGSFGDYLNGILMPILTIINIWVFIRLTEVINSSDRKQKEAELSHQKKLLLIQLRQNEYDKFASIINEKLVFNPDDENKKNIFLANAFLISFNKSKRVLFPIITSADYQIIYLELHKLLTKHLETYRSPSLIEKDENVDLMVKLHETIDSINSKLQDFILSEIQ